MSNHARRAHRHHPVTKAVGASGTILTLGAALVAATPGTAGAAIITVDSALDDNGAGTTLREAIVQANTDAVPDVINFAPALNGQTITLTSQIDIEDPVTITGPGATLLTVSGDDGSRIFYLDTGAGNVTMSGLTLTAGSTGGDGGAIYSDTTGAVTLTNMVFDDNYAEGDGGGLHLSTASSVTITGTTFSSNESGDSGGGAHIYDVDGAVNISNTTFDQNYANDYGGGLQLYGNDGVQTVSGSTFTENNATKGGGISIYYNSGTVNITGTTITGADSEHTSYGGGIDIYHNEGDVTITDSTIADNRVNESAGGIRAVYSPDSDVTITRSTISGNYASVDGGGIYAYHVASLTVTNSTVSGNEAQSDGGGVKFSYVESGDPTQLVLSHDTITGNIAGDGEGGGLRLGDSNATIDHTIIAGNTGGDVVGDSDGAGEVSNSLIGDQIDITLTDGGNNELGVTDAGLGPLADNGGPTQTHALLAGSPALNSGDPTFAAPPATDQRGEARVSDEVIDKGAYEAQVDEPQEPQAPPAEPVPGAANFTG